jgi:hypothetical protein
MTLFESDDDESGDPQSVALAWAAMIAVSCFLWLLILIVASTAWTVATR